MPLYGQRSGWHCENCVLQATKVHRGQAQTYCRTTGVHWHAPMHVVCVQSLTDLFCGTTVYASSGDEGDAEADGARPSAIERPISKQVSEAARAVLDSLLNWKSKATLEWGFRGHYCLFPWIYDETTAAVNGLRAHKHILAWGTGCVAIDITALDDAWASVLRPLAVEIEVNPEQPSWARRGCTTAEGSNNSSFGMPWPSNGDGTPRPGIKVSLVPFPLLVFELMPILKFTTKCGLEQFHD